MLATMFLCWKRREELCPLCVKVCACVCTCTGESHLSPALTHQYVVPVASCVIDTDSKNQFGVTPLLSWPITSSVSGPRLLHTSLNTSVCTQCNQGSSRSTPQVSDNYMRCVPQVIIIMVAMLYEMDFCLLHSQTAHILGKCVLHNM